MKKQNIIKNCNRPFNKKAFFTNPIVDIFVYIVFAMFVIFVLSISAFISGSIERSIKSEFQDIDAEKMMLSYFRTPIKIDSNEAQASDLFLLFYFSDDMESKAAHKKMLQEDITKIFYHGGKFLCWSMLFPNDKNNKEKLDKVSNCNFKGEETTKLKGIRTLDFYFPVYNDAPLRVQLRYGHFENKARLE